MLKSTGYAGKYIGGYYISLELASSSSSRVFLGESVSPDKHTVAIKRLYALHIASRKDQENFLQEADILKHFNHPHILPLLSADILKGTPYIISKYASNGTLHDRLQLQQSRPTDQNEALTILAQVGQALYYAHQKKRIHGNLKPQNIFFDEQENALLGDFKFTSLSSLLHDILITSPATFTYMAPEQVNGPGTQKSDQYALGCIAYELFTNRKPFTTPSIKQPGIYYKTRALISPAKLNPTLPTYIEQAILKAMEKDPEKRHSSILDFLKALGIPGTFTTTDVPTLVPPTATLTAQPGEKGKPLFPGLKAAPAGATTLAQYSASARAALFRKTLTSLAGFPASFVSNTRPTSSATGKKSNFRRSFLIAVGILLTICLIGGLILATTPYTTLPGNKTSTPNQTRATSQTPTSAQGGVPGVAKTGAPQATATNRTGGITISRQPIQPVQPKPTVQPTTQAPTPITQPTPSPTTPLVAILSVAPVSFNSANCTPNSGSYICQAHLALSAGTGGAQNWYTYSTNNVAANFSPSSGTITPGQTIAIKITVFNTCTKPGTFVFVSTKTNVTAAWNC